MTTTPRTAVIFDWDGTIADSRHRVLHCFHTASTTVLGRRFPATAEEERAVWVVNGHAAALMHDDAGVQARLGAMFARAYTGPGGPPVQVFDGMRDALRVLRAHHHLAVVTAKRRTLLDADRLGLDLTHLIDAAVCADEVATQKPDPEGVRRALTSLGVHGRDAVLVGDSPQDIRAGRAAGTRTLGATWGHFDPSDLRAAGADAIARHPRELPHLVAELLGATA